MIGALWKEQPSENKVEKKVVGEEILLEAVKQPVTKALLSFIALSFPRVHPAVACPCSQDQHLLKATICWINLSSLFIQHVQGHWTLHIILRKGHGLGSTQRARQA